MKCVVKTHLECERVESRRCSFTKPQRDAGGKITGVIGETGRRPTGDGDGLLQVQMGPIRKVPPKCRFTFFKKTDEFSQVLVVSSPLDCCICQCRNCISGRKNSKLQQKKIRNVYLNATQTPWLKETFSLALLPGKHFLNVELCSFVFYTFRNNFVFFFF